MVHGLNATNKQQPPQKFPATINFNKNKNRIIAIPDNNLCTGVNRVTKLNENLKMNDKNEIRIEGNTP